MLSEDKLRKEYEALKEYGEVWEISEEEENTVRLALLQDLEKNRPHSLDEFNKLLDEEFSIFKDGEEYDYVKDMKDAFSDSLSKTNAQRIFETIPEHAFWDIKTPQSGSEKKFINPYNPFRAYPTSSFFDVRDYEEYNDRRKKKENLRDAVSIHRRY